jgi:hypothetical protein
MSAYALFVPATGDFHTPADDRIAELAPSLRVAADAVWKAIVDWLPKDKTEMTITDANLRRSKWLAGYSERFVQKGLHALEFGWQTKDNPDAPGLIVRKRRRGLRTIIVVARLRGRKSPSSTRPKKMTDGARSQIPNVGVIPMATSAQQAAAAAAVQAAADGPPGPIELSPEEQANHDRFFGKDRPRSGP